MRELAFGLSRSQRWQDARKRTERQDSMNNTEIFILVALAVGFFANLALAVLEAGERKDKGS